MQVIRKKPLPVLNGRLKNLSVGEIEKLLGDEGVIRLIFVKWKFPVFRYF